MFFLKMKSYVVYPACGSDLSPLLAGFLMQRQPGYFPEQLSGLWSANTLLLCDNSEAVFGFYTKLKKGDFIYSSRDKILASESLYRDAWIQSGIESFKVETIESRKAEVLGEQVSVIEMSFSATKEGNVSFVSASFFFCDYNKLEQHIMAYPKSYRVSGLLLLGMQRYPGFSKRTFFPDTDFLISDFPPNHFSGTFLPIQNRIPELGRPNRSFSAGEGAAIYLSETVFSKYPLYGENFFWIIPGLIGAKSGPQSDLGPEKGHHTISIDSFFEAIGDDFPNFEKELVSLLDEIDKSVDSEKVTVLWDEGGQEDRLLLVIGCWIVRHGIASGTQVNEHISSLIRLGQWQLQTQIENEGYKKVRQSWVKGL
ncbi:MAG: hypothetical protein LAT67_14380 [Balneolales bacterium]|nr:hypothetical protein [Balneolales bacterium]